MIRRGMSREGNEEVTDLIRDCLYLDCINSRVKGSPFCVECREEGEAQLARETGQVSNGHAHLRTLLSAVLAHMGERAHIITTDYYKTVEPCDIAYDMFSLSFHIIPRLKLDTSISSQSVPNHNGSNQVSLPVGMPSEITTHGAPVGVDVDRMAMELSRSSLFYEMPAEPNVNRIRIGERTYLLTFENTNPVSVSIEYSTGGNTYRRDLSQDVIPLLNDLPSQGATFTPPTPEDLRAIGAASYDDLPHHLLCFKADGGHNKLGALTCSCRRFWGLESYPKCVAGTCRNARQEGHAFCGNHLQEIRP